MANYINNANELRELFEDVFNEDLNSSIRIEQIIEIRNRLDDYLSRYEDISNGIVNRYENAFGPEVSESTKRYQAVTAINEEKYKIENLLKEGYLYIDIIREFLTGEKITYQIGIFDQEKSILRESDSFTILDILEYSTVDVDSKISIRNAAKLKMKQIPVTQIGNPVKIILEENVENASSVFSAVYNYTHNTLGKTPKINKGIMYETYRLVLDKYFEGKNRPVNPPAIELDKIAQAYNEVKSNNAAFYKGGDIGTIQVKYLGGRPPSIATLASIERILKATRNSFKNIGKTNKIIAKKQMAQLLGKKEDNIVEKGLSLQQQKIEETLKKLQKSLSS